MVKADVVRKIRSELDVHSEKAEDLVNDLLDLLKDTLESGENVLVTGFGKFELRSKTARPGRDPKSKKDYEISARRVVTFHPSKVWREALNA